MNANRIIVIETRDQLRALPAPFLIPRRVAAVKLPTLPEAERHAWEVRLRRLLGACGCEAGAICLILSVVGYAGWAILGGPLPVSSLGSIVVLGLGFATLASLLGKVVALTIARYRFQRAVRRLEPRLRAS